MLPALTGAALPRADTGGVDARGTATKLEAELGWEPPKIGPAARGVELADWGADDAVAFTPPKIGPAARGVELADCGADDAVVCTEAPDNVVDDCRKPPGGCAEDE